MINFLLKERNKLPSQRIFRPTTFSERKNILAEIKDILTKCVNDGFDSNNVKEFSLILESLIYQQAVNLQ